MKPYTVKMVGIAGGVIAAWVQVKRRWVFIGNYANDADAMVAANKYAAGGER